MNAPFRPPVAAKSCTPQVTIEAIMYSVRARGVEALKEPATVERLERCDEAAKQQINQRIAVLKVLT